jgi:16S rRNA (cytosine(967)-C(5))-methyltransferase
MKRPYREHHLLSMLDEYEQQKLPLDVFISFYFKNHKALGSKDRAHIAETVYDLMRWKGLLSYLAKDTSWEKCYDTYTNDFKPSDYLDDENISLHTRLSFPENVFNLFVSSHGVEKATELCLISNQKAPTTIRANTLKTTRDELLAKFKQQNFQVKPCQYSKDGIVFLQKIHFFSLPEFQEGLFEIQDEGSQLVAGHVQAQPGELVMDYCAGSGGKALAFAPLMQNKGQIFLHDIRPWALTESKKRFKRAGVQNVQTAPEDDNKLKKIKKKMDWVLVDAPCSGTGTLRRNCDMKWKFTDDMVTRLVGQQRMIFEKALSYLKPTGSIVYATCSLLKEENEQQVEHFCKTYGLQIVGDPFISLPSEGGMDGFYSVVMKKG